MDVFNWDPLSNFHTPSPPSEDDLIGSGLRLASANPKKRAGRKKFKETRHPVYRGVRQRNSGKWVCEVREPNKKTRIWLGTFPTPDMAARAHDVAAIALRGRSGACLNFADSAWCLPALPSTAATKDIQRAALKAAETFHPPAAPTTPPHHQDAEVGVGPSESQLHVTPLNCINNDYMDEDAIFGMPGLVADMYQGLMLPPPTTTWTLSDDLDDDVDYFGDVSLWSYSI